MPDAARGTPSDASAATQLLVAARREGAQALQDLVPLLYDELHQVASQQMRRERAGHTLQTTAVLHEAYVKLVDQRNVDANDRTRFMSIAANVIRRVLVEHARGRSRQKRGGDWQRVPIECHELRSGDGAVDVVLVSDLLDKLALVDELQVRIVELRVFADLTFGEIAAATARSVGTVHKEWRMALAWLRRALGDDDS